MLKFDFDTYTKKYVSESMKNGYYIEDIIDRFKNKDLSPWMNINSYISSEELLDIINTSNFIINNCEVFLVIGIGGSYMGAKAIIDALSPIYNKRKPEIIFLGTNLCASEYQETLDYIKDKEIIVNVISKSGTTLEPAIAFDLVMDLLITKYDESELQKRIIITTDKNKGELRKLVNLKNYKSFVVPDQIGGRFSVFTAVGLLPIGVAGINLNELLLGVKEGNKYLETAIEYSIIRDILYRSNKLVESFTIYNPKLFYITEWLKQLFGESQGKDNKGLFPVSNVNTRDLHSLGQFLQDGNDIVFETVIGIEEDVKIDILGYKIDMNEINKLALEKVAEAHFNGNTPSNIIKLEKLDEFNLGELLQFFIFSNIIGSIFLEVNPFDQPGVEEYKRLLHSTLASKKN